jgi:methionine-rich copper-binding protein CopC
MLHCRSVLVVPVLSAALAIAAASADPATAHAIIVDATPAVDATVAGPDVAVVLHFNSRIDRERSRLNLVRPDGKIEPLKSGRADSADTLAATAHALAPGDYKLRWQVLAVDGHITRGDIPFHVAAR